MKNLSKTLIIFLLLLIFSSCFSKKQNIKNEIIPADTMAQIVADIYFIESEIYVKEWTCDIKNYSLLKYDSFFEKRKITRAIFMNNLKFYLSNEKTSNSLMEKIDKLVDERIAMLRDSLENE